MSDTALRSGFLRRFDRLCARMRRVQIGRAVCWSLLGLTLGVAALAAADYVLELDWRVRAIGFGTLAAATLLVLGAWIALVLRHWRRPETAVEVERRFPELGQSVRTAVQFGGRRDESLRFEGVAPTLLAALESETDAQAEQLGIDEIVPTGRLQLAACAALAALVAMLTAAAVNWEWRTATRRALMDDTQYTSIEVQPGDATVDAGASLPVSLSLSGRDREHVVLQSRPLDEPGAEWVERVLTDEEAVTDGPRTVRYLATLDRIRQPLEYRVVADDVVTESSRINVRYPLGIQGLEIDVTPPEYTGLPTTTATDGNLHVVDGSRAAFRIKLDRAPASATLTISPTARPKNGEPGREPLVLPMTIDGTTLMAELDLAEDVTWSVSAEAADGTQLPENLFRIRVRKDHAPQVWFDEPQDPIEVHALAEILMRVRARDDFGLGEVAIVFQINNEEEHTLQFQDFQQAAAELQSTGRLAPQTQAALERVLPLEHFLLTQNDSVIYYAYAKDNRPGQPHRTVTDLRFIDIRPFRQIFRQFDPMDGDDDGMGGRNPASLGELISRQRFALNRTLRLARTVADGTLQPDLNTVDRLIEFESELAAASRELADFLNDREADGSDLIYQAEASMLAAVDSLRVGKYDNAADQERDALRYLIEGADKLELFLQNNPRLAQELRRFDRMLTQKLRRERDDELENPQDVIDELRRLAREERAIAQALAGMRNSEAEGAGGGGAGEPDPEANEGTGGTEEMPEGSEPAEDAGEPMTETTGEGQAGETEPMATDEPSGEMTREELETRQTDVAIKAAELQRVMEGLSPLTELARERMDAAAESAEAASGALVRGEDERAAESAEEAAERFGELALHVEALLAPEAAQQIAMARNLAGSLAAGERNLAEQMNAMEEEPQEGAGDEESADEPEEGTESGGVSREELAEMAERLAGGGRTLEDVLTSVAMSDIPADREAVNRVEDLLQQEQVSGTVDQMERVAAALADGMTPEVESESRDAAERLEIVAARLDELHRMIVSPRIAELQTLEAQAMAVQEDLDELETEQDINEWFGEALELLDELEKAGAAPVAREEFEETLKGGSEVARREWQLERQTRTGRSVYVAPAQYRNSARNVVEELQEEIQLLALGDLLATGDEAVPPEYEHLVERYQQVLSSESGSK